MQNPVAGSTGSDRTMQLSIALKTLCDGPTLAAHSPGRPSAACNGESAGVMGSPGSDLTIGGIIDRVSDLGFGFVAAILALASVPLVGLTVPFGVAVAALGVQMLAGASRPWLPQFIRRRSIAPATLQGIHDKTAGWAARMARVVHPRLGWLTARAGRTLCGAGLLIQGLSLTLPIPGADWLFVIPIVLYGVGLMERDGLLILVCHALTLAQVVLGIVLWEAIAAGFTSVYQWAVSTF